MARKNLLQGLMDAKPETDDTPKRVDAAKPRYSKGAIGAVSQSIQELKSRAILELDPHSIQAGGMSDRLEHDEDAHRALMDSIRNHGQQVPVLVRPHPEDADSYQIVYGRRRVLAMRDLGLPVKAMVRDLEDKDLVIAQGQENAARRDLSYIEKAHFAGQMRDAGYDRPTIIAALHVDKTQISRMLTTIDALPNELITRIGAAPAVGRDRWRQFSEAYAAGHRDLDDVLALLEACFSENSNDRFDFLWGYIADKTPQKSEPKPRRVKQVVNSSSGLPLATVEHTATGAVLKLKNKDAHGFDQWLVENLSDLHARFENERKE